MNIYADFERRTAAAIERLVAEGKLPAGLSLSGIEVQEPRDASHGDLAINAALALAKAARMKPREIAELLKAALSSEPELTGIEIAGPGFLNLRLKPGVWQDVIRTIVTDGNAFGRSNLGTGMRAHVEYVSANPTGPMHVGHCRGAVFGDTLCNLLAFAGYDVTREYYVNDAGGQVQKLGQSTFLRYREALGEPIGVIPPGLYPGEYLKPVGAALAETHGRGLLQMPEADSTAICRDAAIKAMMIEIKADLGELGVHHDVFFSEASLTRGGRDMVKTAIERLRAGGHIVQGRLPPPKGHDEDDWEDREQTLFHSTAFGDDMDRALMKSDGTYTYFAGDVAYHLDKIERGFDLYFNVLGADHVGYIPRLKAVVSALSGGKAHYETPVSQLVKVLRNGEIVRMSKRAGTFVALRDVVDEVGRDPVRFMMLYRKNDSALDFDLAKVVEQSKDNPAFYVQYAHARAASAFRNAREAIADLGERPEVEGLASLERLTDTGEIDLAKRLARFPRIVEQAAREREPHRLPFYLYDLASAFHAHWTAGNASPQLRFIQAGDRKLTLARLALVSATQRVLASGLGILGVSAPQEMHRSDAEARIE